jgi:hypothetical protein
VPQGVVGDDGARANREIVLAQRGEQIRDRLQGAHDPIAQDDHQGHP